MIFEDGISCCSFWIFINIFFYLDWVQQKKNNHTKSLLWAILQQGVRFDPDMPQTIRLEFAKSNTKVSKPKQQAANAANTHPTLMHPLTGRKYTPNLSFSFFNYARSHSYAVNRHIQILTSMEYLPSASVLSLFVYISSFDLAQAESNWTHSIASAAWDECQQVSQPHITQTPNPHPGCIHHLHSLTTESLPNLP